MDYKIENEYLNDLMQKVMARNANEPEFHQAVYEFLNSIAPALPVHPELIEKQVLERIVEPERQIMFRVAWIDDNGRIQVNRGYRIQFNSAIGPYKGGIRLHPSVNLGIIKFLLKLINHVFNCVTIKYLKLFREHIHHPFCV